jgi:hypothetical protein
MHQRAPDLVVRGATAIHWWYNNGAQLFQSAVERGYFYVNRLNVRGRKRTVENSAAFAAATGKAKVSAQKLSQPQK